MMVTDITSIVVIALISIAIGLIVWAADKRHTRYGAVLPIGVAVSAAMVVWIVTAATNLTQTSGWQWVPWIASLVIATAVSVIVSTTVGRTREHQDTQALSQILKH